MSSQTSGPLARGAGAGCANATPPPGIVAAAAAPVARWRNRRRGSVMAFPPGIHALPAPHIRTGIDYDARRNARRGDVAYWHELTFRGADDAPSSRTIDPIQASAT